MIVKLERLNQENSPPKAIVSTRWSRYREEIPFKDVSDYFGERENKVYCRARLDNGELIIGRKILPQPF